MGKNIIFYVIFVRIKFRIPNYLEELYFIIIIVVTFQHTSGVFSQRTEFQ